MTTPVPQKAKTFSSTVVKKGHRAEGRALRHEVAVFLVRIPEVAEKLETSK
jgi:hypothetical protein